MSQFQQKVELVCSDRMTEDVVRLTFNAPTIAAHARPGQFVMVQTSPGKDPLLRRPFSIHQVTSEGYLQILFKVFVWARRSLCWALWATVLPLVHLKRLA